MTIKRDELDEALAKASTQDKTVIIAIINKAYVEGDKSMLDLFLDGFWLGDDTRTLTDHLLMVAVDQTSYERCKFLRLHCYKLETDGVEFGGEKLYMSSDFIKMMWRRTLFLGDVLKRGYNFIFTVCLYIRSYSNCFMVLQEEQFVSTRRDRGCSVFKNRNKIEIEKKYKFFFYKFIIWF